MSKETTVREVQRTAVIFLDGDAMKVVFGRTVKELSASKVRDEKAFFERLFKEYRVVVVEKAVEVKLGQLMDDEPAPVAEVPWPEERKEKIPPAKDPAERWIRSTSRTTIVIDDLPTGTEVAPGIPLMFSIPHDRAVTMSSVTPEAIEKSVILKRLLANGTLEYVTSTEAARLESEHSSQVAEENDARLQQWAPIIDGVSAADYAKDPTKRFAGALVDGPKGQDDYTPVDVNADEVSEQEAMASMVQKERPQADQPRVNPAAAPVDVSTMSGLLSEIDQAKKEGTRTVARRKVTDAKVIDGANPKRTSRS